MGDLRRVAEWCLRVALGFVQHQPGKTVHDVYQGFLDETLQNGTPWFDAYQRLRNVELPSE